LTQRIKDTLLRDRLMATLSGAFGLLAGLLATLGLDGVISYMVAQRRNEIGLRMGLGADRGSVTGLVMRAGTALALWTARAAPALLFGLRPYGSNACHRERGSSLRRHGGKLCAGRLRISPRSDASLARGIGILEQ